MQSSAVPYRRLDDKELTQTQIRSMKAKEGVIELPLSQELTQQFSSGQYAEVLESLLSPGDFAYTYGFRYPGVAESVLTNSTCIGPALEYSHANPVFALTFTLMLGLYSAYKARETYAAQEEKRKQVRARYEASYSKINGALFGLKTNPNPDVAKPHLSLHELVDAINEQLKYEVAHSSGKMKKMELVFDKDRNIKICCTLEDDEATTKAKKAKKAQATSINDSAEAVLATQQSVFGRTWSWVKRAYNKTFLFVEELAAELEKSKMGRAWNNLQTTLGLGAFSYWILWIGAAVFTGALATGVAGLPFWGLAFAIPAALALPYLGIKLYHWVKNDGASVSDEYAQHKKTAENEMPDLLYKAVREVNYKEQLMQLQAEIRSLSGERSEPSALSLMVVDAKKGAGKTTLTVAASFTTSMFESYGFTQYKFWLTTDFLVKAALLAATAIPLGPVVGLPLFIGYLLYSGYAATKQYHAVQKENGQSHEGKQVVKVEDLADILNKNLTHLNALKLKLIHTKLNKENIKLEGELKNSIEAPSLKKPTVYDFFNRKMTGMFFGRLFVTGAALAIPFAVASIAFPPVTLGIIALSGLMYAGFKLFLDYQQSKKSYADTMLDCINKAEKQIQLAELTDQVVTLKKARKKKKEESYDDALSNSSLFGDDPSSGPSPLENQRVWSLGTPSRTPTPTPSFIQQSELPDDDRLRLQ